MGKYVTEHDVAPLVTFDTRRNSSHSSVKLPVGKTRNQYGYRSIDLTPAEQQAIEGRPLVWGNTASYLSYLDEVGFQAALKRDRPFTVHDRDYSETTYAPIQYNMNVRAKSTAGGPFVSFDILGLLGKPVSNGPGVLLPAAPSDSDCLNMAASWMRDSVPNTRSFNLYRAIAEQRDAPRLARALSLKGLDPRVFSSTDGAGGLTKAARSGRKISKKAGELFLTWVFGVKPTLSDLTNAADAVIRMDRGIRNYVMSDLVHTRSSRGRVVGRDAGIGEDVLLSNSGSPTTSVSHKGVSFQFTWGAPLTTTRNVVRWSWSYEQYVKQFATWEFYVPRPVDLPDRLSGYRQAAEALVGEGASAGTAYDLTPWTWLVDWFVDIGGLLHYQQALADNQVAATSNGWSLFETASMTCTYEAVIAQPGYESYLQSVWLAPVSCTSVYRKHKRRGGNPYSVAPTWSLSDQQWSILSALGLSRGS